mgnify:CR=1 FL=1
MNAAASELEISLTWTGYGMNEQAFDSRGNCIISVKAEYFRPTEVDELLGDATKAKQKLGWNPKN